MSHADEVITDVNRRRVRARAHEGTFTIAWDYPGRTLLEVRILRSRQRVAESADDGPGLGQELVYQDVTGSFRDTGLRPDAPYFYTVFARHPGGEWVRWEEYSLPHEPKGGMRESGRLWNKARGNRIALALALGLTLAGLTLTAAGLLLPVALAAGDGSGGESGDKQPASSAAAAAAAAAEADAGVAAVLEGTGATVAKATPWGGAPGQPAGYRVEYRWAEAQAKALDEIWPLLRSDSTPPQPPYDTADYRIRARDVTALEVDVLVAGPRVLQVMPVDGETEFVLEEQTWAPFTWFPWFSANPWVLAPLFVALAVVLMVRAWRRSRAWNRRLPSMTRHDRQFIARVAVLLFLLAGFAWQFYEGWYAATGPSVDSGANAANSLAGLPLLLIPPGLFVAGLILELSPAPRRGSWALLALLSGAASAYYLAAATTGTTTNLSLTYFILLAVLCLISIPRAFSSGKMGWSRSAAPRYG